MFKRCLFVFTLAITTPLIAQSVSKNDAPSVYIDCESCDMTYIRTELNYVNYVFDRNDADIFIMITRQTTGGNGREYTLTLEGHQQFEGMNDTLVYISEQHMSDDEIRERTLEWLKLGTVRYISRTPLAADLTINFKKIEILEQPEDRWNYWVYQSSFNGWFDGQSSYSSSNLNWRFTASRTTAEWKFRVQLRGSYNEDRYTIGNDNYVNISRNPGLNSLLVKSVSDHFSVGFRAGVFSSTYSNLDRSAWLNPTIEYNLFPYSESTRREFRFQYVFGLKQNIYNELTLYDKSEEILLLEALDIDFELRRHWGSVELSIEGSHYVHDWQKNRLDLNGEVSLKIFKGFSYQIYYGYSLIHDQLALPKGEATQEEILLHQQELETQYNYWGSMGISYTFGSIYNNIVNPRF
ncbi:MAG: hypothetical protein HQ508_07105 [Candidatus Marinimicrobia bacterium]|nr:hypothetical protein [Candidatus Neomarinimicrobiota bacterium]